MAHGKVPLHPCTPLSRSNVFSTQVEVDYTEQEVAISGYPLSAALTCTKVCSAFEEAWHIQ